MQHVMIDPTTETLTFVTQDEKSTKVYFSLSREQFAIFSDALLNNTSDNGHHSLPLGNDVYFSYHRKHGREKQSHFVKFRKDSTNVDQQFKFHDFKDYKKRVHYHILSCTMLPVIFALKPTQCIIVDPVTETVTFETRNEKSTKLYFSLSYEHFHAFNDVLLDIRLCRLSHAVYPIGPDENFIFFSYYRKHRRGKKSNFVKFQKDSNCVDQQFEFLDFKDYKKRVHHHILSLLRYEAGR